MAGARRTVLEVVQEEGSDDTALEIYAPHPQRGKKQAEKPLVVVEPAPPASPASSPSLSPLPREAAPLSSPKGVLKFLQATTPTRKKQDSPTRFGLLRDAAVAKSPPRRAIDRSVATAMALLAIKMTDAEMAGKTVEPKSIYQLERESCERQHAGNIAHIRRNVMKFLPEEVERRCNEEITTHRQRLSAIDVLERQFQESEEKRLKELEARCPKGGHLPKAMGWKVWQKPAATLAEQRAAALKRNLEKAKEEVLCDLGNEARRAAYNRQVRAIASSAASGGTGSNGSKAAGAGAGAAASGRKRRRDGEDDAPAPKKARSEA